MMSDNKNEKKSPLRKKRGSYSISVVSEMFGVHQQTIRLYEKEGLISPSRSDGNTRKFTEEDVNQLEEVIYLTHKLGVNLAGVALILKLKGKIKKMQDEMNSLFDQVKQNLDSETHDLKISSKDSLNKLFELKAKNLDKSAVPNNDLDKKMAEIRQLASEDLDFSYGDDEEK